MVHYIKEMAYDWVFMSLIRRIWHKTSASALHSINWNNGRAMRGKGIEFSEGVTITLA
jgi:hypothetical protein